MDEYNMNLETEVEALSDMQPGTEEKERQSQVVLNLATATANLQKADNEIEGKKIDKKSFIIGTAITGGLGLLGIIFKEVLKFITNKHALKREEDDVVNSVTYNNR